MVMISGCRRKPTPTTPPQTTTETVIVTPPPPPGNAEVVILSDDNVTFAILSNDVIEYLIKPDTAAKSTREVYDKAKELVNISSLHSKLNDVFIKAGIGSSEQPLGADGVKKLVEQFKAVQTKTKQMKKGK
jgi:hypothetical protein